LKGAKDLVFVLEQVFILHRIRFVRNWPELPHFSLLPVDIREELVLFHIRYGYAEVRVKYKNLLQKVPRGLILISRESQLAF
jgi:hypothetical protein